MARKIKELTAALDAGTYIAPHKMTVGQWLDTWQNEYLANVKPFTVSSYEATIRNHLQPGLGAIRLDSLSTHDIQEFYNSLHSPSENRNALSSKTIKNIHSILHHALEQAMLNNYIRSNPSNAYVIPKAIKKKVKPMNEHQIADFLKAIKGHKYENMFLIALFTGMRQGEEGKKKPLDSEESRVNLMAEDEGFDSIMVSIPSSRNRARLPRSLAFRWFRIPPLISAKKKIHTKWCGFLFEDEP